MDVERQIRNAVETHFEKLAPTELKNISVPMDLFRIVLPWEAPARAGKLESRSPKSVISEKDRSFPIRTLALIGIFLVIAIALGWWGTIGKSKNVAPPAPQASQSQSISQKSIAVLPFENLSRDPDNAYFADGIQDEILTRLSKIADLKVISRTSTQHY